MATMTSILRNMAARDREHAMLVLIGQMSRGEIKASSVAEVSDLKQLAYLASLARNRVDGGSKALASFVTEARKLLPILSAEVLDKPQDPLQAFFGAPFPLDAGKVRSEVHLHTVGRMGPVAI